MTWFKLPLFIWSHYAASLIMVLGTPVVAVTLLMVGRARAFGVGIFDPALGGDPILFQHLFWFYSHPAVYIMVLPAMGVISRADRLLRPQAHLRLLSSSPSPRSPSRCSASWSGATTCSSPVSRCTPATIFSVLSMLVAIPSAVKVFNWTATLLQGVDLLPDADATTRSASSACSRSAGLTGLMLATLGIDIHVHDTYFVVAHFHYIMVGGTIMAYLGGLHYWWPKMTGTMYNEFLAQVWRH